MKCKPKIRMKKLLALYCSVLRRDMKRVVFLFVVGMLIACGGSFGPEDENDVTSKFKGTWNIYESLVKNSDNSITYYALPWGGLVASFKERNMPVDWSGYEYIRFDFAEPTKVPTQIMVSDKVKTWGKAGITSLTCFFDGLDVRAIDEVALQASDTTVLKIKQVYLNPGNFKWDSTPIWSGNCMMGNWEKGFVIKPDMFTTAQEGDKIELVLTTDRSNHDITYWLMKTIYDGTDKTLEGNENELNNWGCITLGKSATRYRIMLTHDDVEQLRVHGLFVNGYYCNVTQVNLLRRDYSSAGSQEEY